MTTDTDPRVQHAIELAGELRRDELAALKAYLAAEFAKVPSAPVEAVPQLPHPGSSEASEAIDAMLKEYDYPANTKNAARAGYQAARRMLATNPPQAGPSIEQQLQNAREDFAAMKALTESGAAEIARLTAELQEVRKDATLPMSEAALEAAAKAMAEAFDYPWGHMPTVGRINMRTIAKNVIDAAMTKEKPTRTSRPLTADDFPPHLD